MFENLFWVIFMNKRFLVKIWNSLYIFLSLLISLLREKSASLQPSLCHTHTHTHTHTHMRTHLSALGEYLKYNLQFFYFGVSKCMLIVVSDDICVLMLNFLILPLKTLQGYIPWIYEGWSL